MDKLIRIIIMIICFIAIPYLGNMLYSDFKIKKEDLKNIDKIGEIIIFLLLQWVIIIPCYTFMECLKYLIQ